MGYKDKGVQGLHECFMEVFREFNEVLWVFQGSFKIDVRKF